MVNVGGFEYPKELKAGVTGSFFKCTKEIKDKNPKKFIQNYYFDFSKKSGSTYLIGSLFQLSLNIYDVARNIIGVSEIFEKCTKKNGKIFFDFVLWFKNGEDIENVKKIDDDLIVLENKYPILSMVAYKEYNKFSIEKSYHVCGEIPDFLYTNWLENVIRNEIYEEFLNYVEYIDPLYKKELFDELAAYKSRDLK